MQNEVVVFTPEWFHLKQSSLLKFANSWFGCKLLQLGKVVPKGREIISLSPNGVTWIKEQTKSHRKTEVNLHSSDKYASLLYHRLKALWWTLHFIDWLFSFIPTPQLRLNFGFDTLDFNPQSGEGPFNDGIVARVMVPGETLSVIRAGVGTNIEDISSRVACEIGSDWDNTDKYEFNARGIISFNSYYDITTPAVLLSGSLKFTGNRKENDINDVDLAIVGQDRQSITTIVNADYQSYSTTRLCTDISYASFNAAGLNTAPLNADGLQHVRDNWGNHYTDNVISFMAIMAQDLDGDSMGWNDGMINDGISGLYFDSADTANDPILTLEYIECLPVTDPDEITLGETVSVTVELQVDSSETLTLSEEVSVSTGSELFEIERAKKTGGAPVWILECPFTTGTIFLSDMSFSIAGWKGGVETLPWIKEWGNIDEEILSGFEVPPMSDFSCEVIIDRETATDINDILWDVSNDIESTDCTLYLWYIGLDGEMSPPEAKWVGNIKDPRKQGDMIYSLGFTDQFERLNKYVGDKLDLTDFPSCDPDDVGKVAQELYGDLEKVPCLAVDAGAMTSIPSSINAAVTSFDVSDASRLAAGKVVMIDSEEILIGTVSGDTLSGCTRGYNSTIAVTHLRGAVAWEKKSNFVYLWANHPVKSIGKIYGRVNEVELDITAICTAYTGQTGDELTGYEGKAVVSLPGFITVAQSVDLLVDDGIGIDDAIAIVSNHSVNDTISVYDTIAVSDTIGVSQGSHGHGVPVNVSRDQVSTTGLPTTFSATSTSSTHYVNFASPGGTIIEQTRRLTFGNWVNIDYVVVDGTTYYSPTDLEYALSGGGNSITIVAWAINPGTQHSVTVNSSSRSVFYTQNATATNGAASGVAKTGAASKTGGAGKNGGAAIAGDVVRNNAVTRYGAVTMSGNSVANTLVGTAMVVSGEGYQDDGSGTITGTPNALIERPDHVIHHLFLTWSGISDFYTDAASELASKGYKFAGGIDTYKRLAKWCNELAFQARCRFRLHAGQPQLTWRPDSITPSKTITNSMIDHTPDGDTMLQGPWLSPYSELINKIALHYNRDWNKSGEGAYRGIKKDSSSTSITRYGEKEIPELFFFDFVRDTPMALDVLAFYLAILAWRKRVYTLPVHLDLSTLLSGDGITLEPEDNLTCQVRKMNYRPGNGEADRIDGINMTVREY